MKPVCDEEGLVSGGLLAVVCDLGQHNEGALQSISSVGRRMVMPQICPRLLIHLHCQDSLI